MEKNQKDNGSHLEIQRDIVESWKKGKTNTDGPTVDMNLLQKGETTVVKLY